MAINLYSQVEVKPSGHAHVEVEADIPLYATSITNRNLALSSARNLLAPLRLAAKTTLRHLGLTGNGVSVNVECEIPIGAGLGSSASINVAIISAVSRLLGVRLDKKEICKLAFTPENVLHGKSSGVDQATCSYGGIIQFTRPFNVKPVRIRESPKIVVCDTGIHHSTKNLVGAVLKRSKKQKSNFQRYVSQVKQISHSAVRALETQDDTMLGSLMYENHELLRKVGVSHPMLDKLVETARRAGALGAKLTGAGGGGCILALYEDTRSRTRIVQALRRQGGYPYIVSMDYDGVQSLSLR
jgi:mevalonate kinase